MKHKYELKDWVELNDGNIVRIEDLGTSGINGKTILSYWCRYDKRVYPDGKNRNVHESSIKGLPSKRILLFKTIDDWNRPIFKQVNTNLLFCNVDILFGWEATWKEVSSSVDETLIEYFGTRLDDDPMGGKIKPEAIKLIF